MTMTELLPPGVYPIWSSYDSDKAAEALMDALAKDETVSTQNARAGILKDMAGMVYVFIGMFQGLVSEVQVYRTHEDAADAFTHFCGVSYEDFPTGRTELESKFKDSTIYTCPVW